MDFIASAARSAYALASIPLCAAARRLGWVAVPALSGELLLGAAFLELGGQQIAVRLVQNLGPEIAALLELLRQDVLRSVFLEEVIVMVDFRPEAIRAYRECFMDVHNRRVVVGSPEEYLAWLPARLGPVKNLAINSPIRRLGECLLGRQAVAEPMEKRPASRTPERSKISRSFIIGRDGVQSFETLFAHVLGTAGVVNLEEDRKAQGSGFDLMLHPAGGDGIKVEVKTEDFKTGNISLETFSCYRAKIPYRQIAKQTPGWLMTSTADILSTILWPSGDMLLTEFGKTKEWVINRRPQVALVEGTVKEQHYHSLFYLTSINMLLREVPESIHLQLGDWMPTLFQSKFTVPTLITGDAKSKTLHPQRLV